MKNLIQKQMRAIRNQLKPHDISKDAKAKLREELERLRLEMKQYKETGSV